MAKVDPELAKIIEEMYAGESQSMMAAGKCGPCPACGKPMKAGGGQCTCMNEKCKSYLEGQPA